MAVRAILPLTLTTLGEPYLLTAAGDVLRTFEVSELDNPQLLSLVDAHAHDITAIRLWIRQTVDENGQRLIEPWIVTASLDKTLRKWKLTGKFASVVLLHHYSHSFIQSCYNHLNQNPTRQRWKKPSRR